MAILGEHELREALAGHRAWRRDGDTLVRERAVRDFSEALALAERIGAVAEDWGRHPDVAIIAGNRVRVSVTNTHGAGFTDAELRLVAKVDEVADAPLAPRSIPEPQTEPQVEPPAPQPAPSPPAAAPSMPAPAGDEQPARGRGTRLARRIAAVAGAVGGVALAAAGVLAARRR